MKTIVRQNFSRSLMLQC